MSKPFFCCIFFDRNTESRSSEFGSRISENGGRRAEGKERMRRRTDIEGRMMKDGWRIEKSNGCEACGMLANAIVPRLLLPATGQPLPLRQNSCLMQSPVFIIFLTTYDTCGFQSILDQMQLLFKNSSIRSFAWITHKQMTLPLWSVVKLWM